MRVKAILSATASLIADHVEEHCNHVSLWTGGLSCSLRLLHRDEDREIPPRTATNANHIPSTPMTNSGLPASRAGGGSPASDSRSSTLIGAPITQSTRKSILAHLCEMRCEVGIAPLHGHCARGKTRDGANKGSASAEPWCFARLPRFSRTWI